MLLPTRCPACGTPGPAPCERCATELRRAPSLAVPPGLDALYALLAYDGVGRELVARLKYRNARAVVSRLAVSMAALVAGVATAFDAVTWAPTSVERRRERGFDQAELLARRIARELGLPAPALLRRAHGPPQTGRHAAERHLGPSFAAVAAPRSRHGVIPESVLLVDDVVTTGATLTSAARALRQAGATTLVGLAAARTPLKTRRVASDTRK